MTKRTSVVQSHPICRNLWQQPWETKTSKKVRPEAWISPPNCGLNYSVREREGVGEILEKRTWISFHLSYIHWALSQLFKAAQVPTSKPVLPEKQVGRSHRTCQHWYLGDGSTLCRVRQPASSTCGEGGILIVGEATHAGHPPLYPHCISGGL